MRSKSPVVLVSVVLVAVLAGPLSGQQNRPCLGDVKKFCPDAQPGTKEARECLSKHVAELAPACKARIEGGGPGGGRAGGGGNIGAMLHNCKSELEKHCKEVSPGGGRLLACLKEHDGDLSPSCREALPNRPAPAGATTPAATTPGATPPAALTPGVTPSAAAPAQAPAAKH